MVVMLAIIEIIIEIMLASSPKLLRWTSSEQICQTLAGVRTNETAANVALQHGESKLNERQQIEISNLPKITCRIYTFPAWMIQQSPQTNQ